MATARAAILPEPTSCSTSRPVRASTAPRAVRRGIVRADAGGLDADAARREAVRCFRCDAVDRGCVTVVAGRGPSGRGPPGSRAARSPQRAPSRHPGPLPAGSRRPSSDARRQQEEIDDTRPGSRLLRRRRELHRGDDRRRAGRPLVARHGPAARHGPTWSAASTSSACVSGADLWWIIFVALRDLFLLQVFLGSFIFFYPDVVTGQELPITGGARGRLAFAALLLKLDAKGDGRPQRPGADDADRAWRGALHRPIRPRRPGHGTDRGNLPKLVPQLVTNTNPDVAWR